MLEITVLGEGRVETGFLDSLAGYPSQIVEFTVHQETLFY